MSMCSWDAFRQRVRNAAGQPNTGLHSTRLGPFALFDTVLTVLITAAVWIYFRSDRCSGFDLGSLVGLIVVVLLISVPVHMLFGVETAGVKLARKLITSIGSALKTTQSTFSSIKESSPVPSSPDTSAQTTDSYPLDADCWRAAPVDETDQDFSDI